MEHKQCRGCWGIALILALLFGLLLLPFAKGRVDRALEKQARAELNQAGLADVQVSSDWAKIKMVGPAKSESAARSAAAAMPDRSAVDTVSYRAIGSDLPEQAGVAALATFAQSDPKLVLTGTVASEKQREQLNEAAIAAVGKDSVSNQLKVQPGKTGADVNGAVVGLAGLLGTFSDGLSSGSASLTDTKLVISGVAKDEDQAKELTQAAQDLAKQKLDVSGEIGAPSMASASPTAPSPSASTPSTIDENPTLDAVAGDAALTKELGLVSGIKAIRFPSNSPAITKDSAVILDRVAKVMRKYPDASVTIGGHTDSRGGASTNPTLSQERADAVRKYLISRRVPSSQLIAKGYGSTKPIATNSTAEGRFANRRIDFKVNGS